MGDGEYEDGSYYGVCLNCGSAKCGHHGGCRDNENILVNDRVNLTNEKSTKVIRANHPELLERLRQSVTDLKNYTEGYSLVHGLKEGDEYLQSIQSYFVSSDNDTYIDFLVECLADDIEELESIIEGN